MSQEQEEIRQECNENFYKMERLFPTNITECETIIKNIKNKLDKHGVVFQLIINHGRPSIEFINWVKKNGLKTTEINHSLLIYYHGTDSRSIIQKLSTIEDLDKILTELNISVYDIKDKMNEYDHKMNIYKFINLHDYDSYQVLLDKNLKKYKYKFDNTIIIKVKSPSNKIKIGGNEYSDNIISIENPLITGLIEFSIIEIEKDSVLDVIIHSDLDKTINTMKQYNDALCGESFMYKNGLCGLKKN